MHILFICHEYPPFPAGGIGTFIRNLAENLVLEEGWKCSVIGFYPQPETTEEWINGVRVYRLPNTGAGKNISIWKRLLSEWHSRRKLSDIVDKKIREWGCDLVESYDWTGPLARKPIRPLVVRLHGSHTAHAVSEGRGRRYWLAYWEGRNIRMADQLVAVSEHMASITQQAFGNLDHDPVIIYNTLDTRFFSEPTSESRNTKTILFVGKYHKRKGVAELPAILKGLLPLDPAYRFRFVGTHTAHEAQVFLRNIPPVLHKRIEFHQAVPQSQLADFYHQAGLFIMPTRAEAFGLTAIEAMGCGCIVAMNDIPVAHEIIQDNHTGLVMNMNQTQICIDRLHDLLQHPDKMKMIRSKAREDVLKRFSPDAGLAYNIDLYTSLI